MPLRLVVLVSGSGTLLQALLDAQTAGTLAAQVVAVGSDRADAYGLSRAEAAGVPTFVHPLAKRADRAAWDAELAGIVARFAPDLVVSAGFMKLVGPGFLTRFAMVNTHPALLPSFPGMHGVADALAHGVKVTGATLFAVDEGVDTGRILAQEAVRVLPDDTVGSLHERIKVVERRILVDYVNEYAASSGEALIDAAQRRSSLSEDVAAEPSSMASTSGQLGMNRVRPATVQVFLVRNEMSGLIPIRRALVSVYDKAGLVDLGRALAAGGVELVSTGSTARTLAEAGVPVTPVEQVTGFPECLDGRVKTLHPAIHAGLLADRRLESHQQALLDLDIAPFDLVVSNLYPFEATVASGATPDECVEQIDIGGPSMVRAAAKNHPSVAIVTSPEQYPQVVAALAAGGFTVEQRKALAAAAFVHTATYDVAVASWMGSVLTDSSDGDGFPAWIGATWRKAGALRYGENSHQRAALYRNGHAAAGIAAAEQLHGKEMSYNNYTDADAAYRAAYDFEAPAVAIIKHANPCGIAVGADIAEAHRKAHACDPVSAFGGVIAANRPISVAAARQIAEVFTEVVIAPGYEDDALEVLRVKKNLRLLVAEPYPRGRVEIRPITGGLLLQAADTIDADGDSPQDWQLVAGGPADAATLADLEFAWRACRAVKSNAILLACGEASVGVGMGQVNRVDSCRLAVERAGERAAGSVAASDAFFPFADGPQILIDAGVRAIVQPGGSVRDAETIAAAQAAGVTMYTTGTRHFFH